MNDEASPRVLIVYYTVTKQSSRVTDVIANELEARGCDVTKALIEFTDERWVPHLSQFPMKRPMAQIATILPAQIRHKTGEIRIPAEAQAGDYDLVLVASPTWWFQTCMPIRSYLESPAAKVDPRRQDLSQTCRSRAATTASTSDSSESSLRRAAGSSPTDAFRRGRRAGQVDALLAWIHEARRAAGARHGPEDATAESEA